MTVRALLEFTLPDPTATEALAQALAPRLVPGDALLLTGPVGAGKTAFARALIQARLVAAGLWEDVPSPTFTLVQTYFDGVAEIWHADLYRLSGPAEVVELGLDEAFEEAICLVEWPHRLGALTPADALWLNFSTDDEHEDVRQVTLASAAPGWAERLAGLDGTRLAG